MARSGYGKAARNTAPTGEGKAPTKEPDYLDPSYAAVYLPKAKRFLKVLAARYDTPGSPVMLWGAMGYGQWGEWHTMWSHYPWPGVAAKRAVLKQIVEMYAEVFTIKPLIISYCFDDDRDQVHSVDDYLNRQALDVAIGKGFALARHGFIDGLLMYERLIMERYWRTTPMWSEGNWSYTAVKDEDVHGTLEENILVFAEWHSNYGHFYMDADTLPASRPIIPAKRSWPYSALPGALIAAQSQRQTMREIRIEYVVYMVGATGLEPVTSCV